MILIITFGTLHYIIWFTTKITIHKYKWLRLDSNLGSSALLAGVLCTRPRRQLEGSSDFFLFVPEHKHKTLELMVVVLPAVSSGNTCSF